MKTIDAEPRSAAGFGREIRDHLERVENVNAAALDRLADMVVDVIEHDGLLYVGGAGHSLAMVLETFYRAGGLACVQPLYHPSLLPLNGARESTRSEHSSGLAQLMLQNRYPGPSDLAFVFSNPGISEVPVELAEEFSIRGTPVVAVVSLAHPRAAPARAAHTLNEVAEHILDTLAPYGDASYPTGDGSSTAALSSLTSVYLWDLLLARVADRATERGVRPPVWAGPNVADGAEQNLVLLERYQQRVPEL